jgi:hypothetical protein
MLPARDGGARAAAGVIRAARVRGARAAREGGSSPAARRRAAPSAARLSLAAGALG